MVTGGMAPNREGGVFPGAAGLFIAQPTSPTTASSPSRVHDAGGRIAMQILHAGRYAYGPECVAPSALKSPISPFPPRELDEAGIEKQIADIVTAAARAQEAGYDGVEVMGSEGYFLNQFLVTHTNRRTDRWGGTYENRMRLPVEVVAPGARRRGPGFHPDLPPVADRPCARRIDLGRGRDAGEGRRGGRGDADQHRHRLARGAGADHRHLGAPRGLCLADRAAAARGLDPRHHLEPDQHARGGRRPAGARAWPTWCRWPGPSWPIPISWPRPRRAGPTEIAPCIACNQACLDHTFRAS